MSGTVIVLAEAERDLDEAVEWYDSRQYGVGRRLARAFRDCSRSIADYPESFAIVHGDFRLAMLKFFPYGVYFRTTPEATYIHRVIHQARHPDTWRGQLP